MLQKEIIYIEPVDLSRDKDKGLSKAEQDDVSAQLQEMLEERRKQFEQSNSDDDDQDDDDSDWSFD